jgi:tRNA A37 threonylcarbamoyladenosine dehydratase
LIGGKDICYIYVMIDKRIERLFSGVRRLYGEQGTCKLQSAHVVVIGLGGVGSWAVEALARNAVGQLTLVDLDNVAESNVNRQIQALADNFGLAKVTAMHRRILQINPTCNVHEVEDFITPDNVQMLLGAEYNIVLDCTDDAKAKVALAAFCKQKNIPLLTSGSAGGRLDPTRLQVDDLAFVTGDKLLAKMRNQLRRNHGFPKAHDAKSSVKREQLMFGITCVFSDEPTIKPEQLCETDSSGLTGLNCAGYGSSVSVTATFGFTMAQLAINTILA